MTYLVGSVGCCWPRFFMSVATTEGVAGWAASVPTARAAKADRAAALFIFRVLFRLF